MSVLGQQAEPLLAGPQCLPLLDALGDVADDPFDRDKVARGVTDERRAGFCPDNLSALVNALYRRTYVKIFRFLQPFLFLRNRRIIGEYSLLE